MLGTHLARSRLGSRIGAFRFIPRIEILEDRVALSLSAPSFSSLPGANHTIYLDFDGHTTEGTAWNSYFNNPSIVSPAYSSDADPNSFSAAELAQIEEAWNRVAEDFIPFNVNVTTVDPGSEALRKSGGGDSKWGIRVVITADTEATGSGGIAYIDSFNSSRDMPAFVYTAGGKYLAEAISHEVGHSLGLDHDGTSTSSYYTGHGSGETGWASIMGVGYYKNVTTWDRGEYYGANNDGVSANFGKGADDLYVITHYNGFGYRNDDHGNTAAGASPLIVSGANVSSSGIIGRTSDVDVFSFATETGAVTLDINPFSPGPNLDVRADLYDSAGNLIATSNSPSTLSAHFALTLDAGQYYLHVDGTGFGDPGGNPASGYSDYASMGRYTVSGTIVEAMGSISLDEARGIVTIKGTNGNDAATVSYADGKVLVTLTTPAKSISKQFNATDVSEVVFHGYDGDDSFQNTTWINSSAFGGKGRDVLIGGFGRDRLYGGDGRDVLNGGYGIDWLWGGYGNDRLNGGGSRDYLYGGGGRDRLYGKSGRDKLVGGSGNDYLNGGSGRDKIYGNSGRDKLIGGSGNDYLKGGSGRDKLYGNSGADVLIGGSGADYLKGGGGRDKERS